MDIKIEDIAEDEFDYGHLHDVIVEALNLKEKISREKVIEYFNLLSHNIKCDFLQWGMGDTVARDNAFVFFKENFKNEK